MDADKKYKGGCAKVRYERLPVCVLLNHEIL